MGKIYLSILATDDGKTVPVPGTEHFFHDVADAAGKVAEYAITYPPERFVPHLITMPSLTDGEFKELQGLIERFGCHLVRRSP